MFYDKEDVFYDKGDVFYDKGDMFYDKGDVYLYAFFTFADQGDAFLCLI